MMGGNGELAARSGSAMKKGPEQAKPESKGGTHPCKGKLQNEFAEAKTNPKLYGDLSILVTTLKEGDCEEKKETAKKVLLEKLRNAEDLCSTISDFIKAGDGDQAVKGILTKHFSDILKTSEGLGRIGTLANIKDEDVLIELIKSIADTHDPAALDFIIHASRSCSHPVGAFQAPKVADAGNIDRVTEFVRSEAAKQSDDLRNNILKSAESNGLAGISADARLPSQRTPASESVANVLGRAGPGFSIVDNQLSNAPNSMHADPPLSNMKTEPDLSLFVQTQEAFFKTHGFASVVQDQAGACISPYREERGLVNDRSNANEHQREGGAGAASRMGNPQENEEPFEAASDKNVVASPLISGRHRFFRDKMRFFKEMTVSQEQDVLHVSDRLRPAFVREAIEKPKKKSKVGNQSESTSRKYKRFKKTQMKKPTPGTRKPIIANHEVNRIKRRKENSKSIGRKEKERTPGERTELQKSPAEKTRPVKIKKAMELKQEMIRRAGKMKIPGSGRSIGAKISPKEKNIPKPELAKKVGSAPKKQIPKALKSREPDISRIAKATMKRPPLVHNEKIAAKEEHEKKAKEAILKLLMQKRKHWPKRRS